MKSERGTILITTLWILTILTLLALGIGIRMGVDIKLISFSLNSAKAHYLAWAGLRKTMALLRQDGKKVDYLGETLLNGYDKENEVYVLQDIELGEGNFTVSYEWKNLEGKSTRIYGASDEEGKININKAGSKELLNLFDFNEEIVASVLDWRDEDDIEGNHLSEGEGAESEYYEGLDNPYECRNSWFRVPEELLLVKGVTPEIYDGVKDIITVYPIPEQVAKRTKAKVNINTATKEVLEVLAGFEELEEGEEGLLDDLIKERAGDDGIPGTEDDEEIKEGSGIYKTLTARIKENLGLGEKEKGSDYLKSASNTFRVISTGAVKNGRVKKTIETVIQRSDDRPRILYYYED
jgi:general secretion pathway protein K